MGKKLLVVPLVLYVAFMIFGGRGIEKIPEIGELNLRRNSIKRDILHLYKENCLLREKIRFIQTEPMYIEKIARGDLCMAKPGDKVYKFR